ncbi:MAG: proton-conducting transporter membrane subunit [Rhodocyclaceae bacterium]
MNNWLVVAPVLVPLLGVLLTLVTARQPQRQARLSLAFAGIFLASAIVLLAGTAGGQSFEARFGGWPAPAAIAFAIDRLGAAMLTVSGVVLVAVLIFPSHGNGRGGRSPWLHPLLHGLMTGVGGAFSSADLFNLYVWFEVMLISALGLIVIGARRTHLEAGLKYLVLNLVGTMMLLIAVGGIYGLTGQLNFSAIGMTLDRMGDAPLAQAYVALLLIALLVKAGAFPFFFWLPAAYPNLPTPILALFAGLLTKVGAYAVLRTAGQIAPVPAAGLLEALGWIAVATMLAGVLGAAHHWDTRRILSFHVISQIGYILLGIALGTAAGLAAALFYTLHHIIVKANLFLLGGLIRRVTGSHDLRRSGGLFRSHPRLAALFAIPAASLVGVPLLSGFWAKLLVVRECFAGGNYLWGAAALLVGGLTLYSMLKLWIEAFWKPRPEGLTAPVAAIPTRAWLSCGALAAITLAIGIHPQPLLDFSTAAVSAMPLAGGSR